MRPLNGLRVVDMADEKGELCGRLLADLGADVIRIEPRRGAGSRRLPPFAPDGVTSLYFALRNAGKRSVALDPDAAADRETLHGLLASADVLVESDRPGRWATHALDPASLVARYPALVVTSISDFGHTGPYRDYRGSDMIGFAMGGLMHRAGIPERPPVVAPGALAYDSAGATAAFATLLAYWKRLRTGRGQHVDVSVMESAANLSDWSLPNYSRNPTLGHRAGTGIYTLYRCADGWVRMIILVKHHWRALLDWMGNPEELSDPGLDEFLQRLIRREEIESVIEKFFTDKPKVEVARIAQQRGIPATPLLFPPEVLTNEHCRARGTFREVAVAPGVVARLPSGFVSIDGERVGPVIPPPALDEHAGQGFSAPPSNASAAESDPPAAGDQPFTGLRVLDFGVGAAGVEVGRLLAEFGADVVKIETRKAPDFIRVIMGGFMNPNFASSNRSKRSFGVDLKAEAGRELVYRLLADTDVVIENAGTGVMQRLGLDYAAIQARNPRVVMFSSQLVGSAGPWADWIGYGPSAHAVSGLQYLWNYPEDAESPAGATNVYPDHFIGRLGAFGVLAGLIGRRETGRGLHVDAAQFESIIQLLGDLFAQESLAPGSVAPLGNASALGAPWGAYPCAGEDEWCVVNVRTDAEWRGLREALGDPEWARSEGFDSVAGRLARRGELDVPLAAWTVLLSPRAVMETLQAHGVPAGIVAHPGHHSEDPQLGARGYRKTLDQQDLGEVVLEGPPFLGSDLPPPITTQAPRLGEHTREICRDRLKLSEAEIDRLCAAGVLEDPP